MSKLELEAVFSETSGTQAVTRDFVFFLLPSFSAMSVCAAIEVLSQANEAGATPAYTWQVVSQSGSAMRAETGLRLDVDAGLDPVGSNKTIIICGGERIDDAVDPDVRHWLQRAARHGASYGALGGGVSVLLQCGLASGHPIAAHWSVLLALQETYPDVEITRSVFELTDKVASCVGGTATVDLFLNLVARHNSDDCAQTAAATLACSSIRDKHHEQTMSMSCRVGCPSPHLEQAVNLMHRNTENPVSPARIASLVGISTRQLERLFSKHLGLPPKAYSTKVRLEQARTLLQQTRLPIVEVSFATGFQSTSHFSKLYKRRFSISPSCERGLTEGRKSGSSEMKTTERAS